MPISPLNVSRVSLNLRAFSLLNSVQYTQAGLFRSQNQLATGLRFGRPSEDPARAAIANRLDRALDALKAVGGNVATANQFLAEGESAMTEAVNLVRDARDLTSQAVNDVNADDERQALGPVAQSILDRVVAVGNRKYLDTYLFGGYKGGTQPFERVDDGVIYNGDDNRQKTTVESDWSQDSFTTPGTEFFNAVAAQVRGAVDLNPSISSDTLVSDLRGATGSGVSLGRVRISNGTTQADIDLSGAATIGDIVDKLNAGMPSPLVASLGTQGLSIAPSAGVGDILVEDIGGGHSAVDLGIISTARATLVAGEDLNPKLTLTTPLAQLDLGLGLNLGGSIRIRNGDRTAEVSFNGLQTVEDLLNRINLSNVGVWARIDPDGSTIDVLNRISGTSMTIEETGGLSATALGIRSLHAGTPLSSLNSGLGIDSVDGDDFRITTADGTQVDVDIDQVNLKTGSLQDVIDLLNTRGGGAITATMVPSGNGIQIIDNTVGGGTLAVEKLNLSPAIDSLGLNVPATIGRIMGNDINPVRVDSPFTALVDLTSGLESNDTRGIAAAGARMERMLTHLERVLGQHAAKSKAMDDRSARIDSESTATQVLLSDTRDADMTESIVRFQQLQTALQANLSTANKILSLSLIDYLR